MRTGEVGQNPLNRRPILRLRRVVRPVMITRNVSRTRIIHQVTAFLSGPYGWGQRRRPSTLENE